MAQKPIRIGVIGVSNRGGYFVKAFHREVPGATAEWCNRLLAAHKRAGVAAHESIRAGGKIVEVYRPRV